MLKIPFFRIGAWKHPLYGDIEGTQSKFNCFINNFKNNVLQQKPFVRIGHLKDRSDTVNKTDIKAIVKDMVQEGDTLYAVCEPQSSDIENLIKYKQYRYASAEYVENYFDKSTGKNVGAVLKGIGLTNEPFLTHLPDNIQVDKIYLDYINKDKGDGKNMNEFIKALSQFLDALTEKLKASPSALANSNTTSKLSDTNTDYKKLADEDVLALGGTITEDGRYHIHVRGD